MSMVAPDLLINGLGGVVTGRGDLRADVGAIGVTAGRISSIGASGVDLATDPRARIIDAAGAWAMPGLWDGAHALYFGDHEPTFSAVGALGAGIRFGRTAVVAGGPVAIPAWRGTGRAARELAILTMRSWRYDRPSGLRVETSAITADADWDDADLAAIAAAGAATLMLPAAMSLRDRDRLVKAARASGLRVGFRIPLGWDARATADLLGAAPDVVLLDPGPASEPWLRDVIADAGCPVGVPLAGGPDAMLAAGRVALRLGATGRVFVGSGMPSAQGVLPAALAWCLGLLAAAGVGPGAAIEMAAGNVAAAYALEGGRLEVGAPADIVLTAGDGSGPRLDDLARSGARLAVIGGDVAWDSGSGAA